MQPRPLVEKIFCGFSQYSLFQEDDILTHTDGCPHTLQTYVDSLEKKWNHRSEVTGADFDYQENFYED